MIRRLLVTGGAGFVGSHLCERALAEGAEVVCVDNHLTSSPRNVAHLARSERFTLVESDASETLPVTGPLDAVAHLASPASPRDYLAHPVETLRAGSAGTLRALDVAARTGARFLLASTSEVYGSPEVHPQPERYWGNVNPTGPRAVYDEAKRFAEAAASAYERDRGLEVRIARIFNTIGPRMRPDDGRAVPTFLAQALRGEPMTVHGDGHQTRSLCYVDDLVEGLWRLLISDVRGPVNLGNPEEHRVIDIAELVAETLGVPARIRFVGRPTDDPDRRCPDLGRAREELGWAPTVGLREAVGRTAAWFRRQVPVGRPA